MFPEPITALARELVERAPAAGVMVATAESCTGGLLAGAITEIAGSSAVFDRGFVTYSNAAKTELLGVPAAVIADKGAVSLEAAQAMAAGALARSHATVAVSITGVAGPGGGSADKPVGTVCFGLARRGAPPTAGRRQFPDLDRCGVRMRSAAVALEMLLEAVGPA